MIHDLIVDIKNCKNEKELLKIVNYINDNKKKLKLDDTDISRLESTGIHQYEAMQRERTQMFKNKKQGFNNFED